MSDGFGAKRWIAIILAGTATLFGGVLGKRVVRSLFPREPDPKSQQFLSRVASELNKNLPMAVDRETELLNVAGLESTIVYNYRLVNFEVSAMDPAAFVDRIESEIKNAACTAPETRDDLLRKAISMRYTYVDKNRVHIASLVVTPEACGF